MQNSFKATQNSNWLQKMYDKAIENNNWVYEEWYPKYKKSIEQFAEMFADEQSAETISEDTKNYLILTADNYISSNKQGKFSKEEYTKLLNDWPAIYGILKNCYSKGDVTETEYNELETLINKHTNKNHPAALNRIWAGILPNILTTIIKKDIFKDTYDHIRKIDNTLPPSSNSWIEDNKKLMKFFDEKVSFKDPHHKALFAWYLYENLNNTNSDSKMDRYVNLLKSNHNLILTGAPGTGKTHLAKSIAKAMGATEENDSVKMVQFHPSYDYTDFVEGLRPKRDGEGFERVDGVFKKFCKMALHEEQIPEKRKIYVFIIDEINRGELSKIFGELFFSIDPGYRGIAGRVETQYQNMVEIGDPFDKGFFVPENVYIIGTMNDIDRGVESMDFAIRRRFAWDEVTAESRVEMLEEKIPELAEQAKKSMNSLNNAIEKEAKLSSAYHIGPAYYLKLNNYADEKFESLWKYHIRGVIFEYLRGTRDVEEKLKKLKEAFDDKYKEK